MAQDPVQRPLVGRFHEPFDRALHEAGHAVVAYHLGYAVHEVTIEPTEEDEGHAVYSSTSLEELGLPIDGPLRVLWPYYVDYVRDQIIIAFAGAMAVACHRRCPFREVEGGGGDNESVVSIIWHIETIRRHPELAFIQDSYRSYLYPGGLRACKALLDRDDVCRAVQAVAVELVKSGRLDEDAFRLLMDRCGMRLGQKGLRRPGALEGTSTLAAER